MNMLFALSLSLLVALPSLLLGSTTTVQALATTWYPGWHGADFPPENVPWTEYNEVKYAFAFVFAVLSTSLDPNRLYRVTTPDSSVVSLTPEDQTLLHHFVTVAHQNVCIFYPCSKLSHAQSRCIMQHVKASLAIGGWTGSVYFSSSVATPANRTAFVNAVLGLDTTYQLDGIDFEYVTFVSIL